MYCSVQMNTKLSWKTFSGKNSKDSSNISLGVHTVRIIRTIKLIISQMLGKHTFTCTVWYIRMLVLYSTEYGSFKNRITSTLQQEYLSLPNKTGANNDIVYYLWHSINKYRGFPKQCVLYTVLNKLYKQRITFSAYKHTYTQVWSNDVLL
jgi:hypothetical protein